MVSLYKLGQWVMQKGEVGSACASEGLDLFQLLYIYKLVVNIIKRIKIVSHILLHIHFLELKSCFNSRFYFQKKNV